MDISICNYILNIIHIMGELYDSTQKEELIN